MWENILKNWKSSGAGVIAAIAGLVAILYPDQSETINRIAAAISVLSLAVLGLVGKDNDVTGTAANPRAEVSGQPDPPPTPKP